MTEVKIIQDIDFVIFNTLTIPENYVKNMLLVMFLLKEVMYKYFKHILWFKNTKRWDTS